MIEFLIDFFFGLPFFEMVIFITTIYSADPNSSEAAREWQHWKKNFFNTFLPLSTWRVSTNSEPSLTTCPLKFTNIY